MPIQIDGPRLAPAAGGAPQQLVIFLHGYGADGNDLISLGREWARLLPNAAFVSPHAPEELPGGFSGGRQWFALETRSEHEWEEGVRKAQPALEAFIVAEAARQNLPLSAVALVGFSQGTMIALQTGLRFSQNAQEAHQRSIRYERRAAQRRVDQVLRLTDRQDKELRRQSVQRSGHCHFRGGRHGCFGAGAAPVRNRSTVSGSGTPLALTKDCPPDQRNGMV